MSSNRVIGNKGSIPWYLPDDLKRFKKLTTGNAVIMGRKTHESIGRVLPNRDNVIISRDENYNSKSCIVKNSLIDALKYCTDVSIKHTFIIGGGDIYKQALELDLVDSLYITEISEIFEGDTFFPELQKNKFKAVAGGGCFDERANLKYNYCDYEKRN